MGRAVRKLLRLVFYAVVVFYAVCIAGLLYLKLFPPLFTTVQIQRQVEALGEAGEYDRRYDYVPLGQISDHLEHAVVAAEDTRFFQHSGFDWEEMENAWEEAARRGRGPRGASTITQQLVKNLFLTTHRSYPRKALEYTLTPLAELILSKERILELYLNVIEWGPGVFGAGGRGALPLRQVGRGIDARAGIAPCRHPPRAAHPQAGEHGLVQPDHPAAHEPDGVVATPTPEIPPMITRLAAVLPPLLFGWVLSGCAPAPAPSPAEMPATVPLPTDSAGVETPPGTDIYLVGLTARDRRPQIVGAPQNLTKRSGYDNQPGFTRDGSAVLYTSIREDGQADIFRHDLASGTSTQVTRTPESEYSATVMPDGEAISVVRGGARFHAAIVALRFGRERCTIDLAGRGTRRLPRLGGREHPRALRPW